MTDDRHPNAFISEVCGRAGLPMKKGWAAKIRRVCGDENLDEDTVQETHQQLFGDRSADTQGSRKALLRRLTTIASGLEDEPAMLRNWRFERAKGDKKIVLTGHDVRSFSIPAADDTVRCRFRIGYELDVPESAYKAFENRDPTKDEIVDATDALDESVEDERARLDRIVEEAIADLIEKAAPVLGQYTGDIDAAFQKVWMKALKRGDRPKLIARSQDNGKSACRALRQRMESALQHFAYVRGAEAVKADSGLHDYPGLFPQARAMNRRLRLFVGPTNSGKTHTAMDRLTASNTGVYAAPLRLMAMEAYDRLNDERGVPCALRTGEENVVVENAGHTAATVEMSDLRTPVETAVIDEAQMLGDRERGWAWTQAIIGIPAQEVIMTGSPDAIPWVRTLAAMTGDDLEIVEFERKTPLEPLKTPVAMNRIQRGDAIVAFSKRAVMENRHALQTQGFEVATVYGALSPEVRRNEARRFREGEADVVVATDAIGMGLNLPVHRVLLGATEKFDGTQVRQLRPSEIRQICGRAGRYGLAEKGMAGIVKGAGSPEVVRAALSAEPDTPSNTRPWIMPPWSAVEVASTFLGTDRLRPILDFLHKSILKNDDQIRSALNDTMRRIADVVDSSELPLSVRFGYLGLPIDERNEDMWWNLNHWVRRHASGKTCPVPKTGLRVTPDTESELHEAESGVKTLTMYLWLHQRWPAVYTEIDTAWQERARLDGLITDALNQKVIARACRDCGAKLPRNFPHPICDDCFTASHIAI